MPKSLPPALRETGPSLDLPRPPPIEEDPNFLRPSTPLPAEKSEISEKKKAERHEANKAVRDFLGTKGIPTYDARRATGMSNNNKTLLSASNVEQHHLQTTFRWNFYSSLQVLNQEYPAKSVLRAITEINDSIRANGLGIGGQTLRNMRLKVPHDWMILKKNPSDDEDFLACLAVVMTAVDRESDGSAIMVCSREDIEALEYPTPKVTLHEARKFPDDAANCIEWSLVKVLGFPGVSQCRSEMDVKRHMGSKLTSFFKIAGCETTSNMKLKFPTAIGCFGSLPKPDFATRLDSMASSKFPECFRPIVFLGEAKKVRETDTKKVVPAPPPETDRISAQLAWAVQPTLILIIVDSMIRWEEENRKNKKNKKKSKFELPEYAFIYGVGYDKSGFTIYGFYPRIMEMAEDGTPTKWGFGCAVADSHFANVFHTKYRSLRMHGVQALLVAQRHAVLLSEKLREIDLPKAFYDCADIWETKRLWGDK